ncbi:hypothetical protein MLD38_003102 [Melastoma candidum]|uniref:Uncharacterized protein n=1 Tax=Melastoma candidum TaxID=119954 RepID=A0ACB9S3G9_9MYRT|nr:hypothetical protein MLD38_003102 [Melastoma candidum]
MASSPNRIPIFLFLFGVALIAPQLQVHARESKFFSKVTNHMSVNSKTTLPLLEHPLEVPVAAPDLAPAPALSPASAAEELVYRSRSNGVPSAWERDSTDGTSIDAFGGRISGEELVGGTFEGYGSGNTFSNNLNYNGEVNARPASGFSSREAYPVETQQGMSDTRYLEKGRYFYHLKGENGYGNTYEPEVQTAADNTYTADENSSDTYEFDTMEEYYKKQGMADLQDQGVYVP